MPGGEYIVPVIELFDRIKASVNADDVSLLIFLCCLLQASCVDFQPFIHLWIAVLQQTDLSLTCNLSVHIDKMI